MLPAIPASAPIDNEPAPLAFCVENVPENFVPVVNPVPTGSIST